MSQVAQHDRFNEHLVNATGYEDLPSEGGERCREFESLGAQCGDVGKPVVLTRPEEVLSLAVAEAGGLVAMGLLGMDVPHDQYAAAASLQKSAAVLKDWSKLGQPIDSADLITPSMNASEFGRLMDDIGAHGQRDPIVMRDGKVLHGKHRLLACYLLAIEPKFVEWQGAGSPTEYVLRANIHWRQWTDLQRAFVAARAAEAYMAEAKQRSLQNLQQNKGNVERLDPTPRELGGSIERAAMDLNVSVNAAKAARKVLMNGDPMLVQAAENGEVSLDAAVKVTERSKEEQRELLANGGVREAAKQIRQVKTGAKAKATTNASAPSFSAEISREIDAMANEHGPQMREFLLDRRWGLTSETIKECAKLPAPVLSVLCDAVAEGRVPLLITLLSQLVKTSDAEAAARPVAKKNEDNEPLGGTETLVNQLMVLVNSMDVRLFTSPRERLRIAALAHQVGSIHSCLLSQRDQLGLDRRRQLSAGDVGPTVEQSTSSSDHDEGLQDRSRGVPSLLKEELRAGAEK